MTDFAETSALTALLPDYTPSYKITEFRLKDSSVSPSEQHFVGEIRLAIKEAETAKQWVKKFEESSNVTLRIRATDPPSERKQHALKVYYRCQHNTRPVSATADHQRGSKNTSCPALMTLTVKSQLGKSSKVKNKDPLLVDFPTVVRFEHTHNHILSSADSLRHRDVSAEVINKFTDLFSRGHSPSSALEVHKMDLQLEHGTDYVFESADRAKCPDLQFCHRLYKKLFEKAYGVASSSSVEETVESLQAACSNFNSDQDGIFCKAKLTASGKIAIAICTPLMQRVHELHRASGEMVFMDASGGMDRYDCRTFLLLTHSSAGGLPLGCLIVSSEAADVVTEALNLYKELLPPCAFYGRGMSGPQVFLTNDCDAERKSLQQVFPDSVQLLCAFHVLQAAWRFLWDSHNRVQKEHRQQLLSIMKTMVFVKTEKELEEVYSKACANNVVGLYPKYGQYLQRQYRRRTLWALCLREDLPVRGNHTNNYCEAAMHVLKDKVFCRTRAYNVQQLLHFLLTRLPAYYERRLLDLANGKMDSTIRKRYLVGKNTITKEKIKCLGNLQFEVASESDPDKCYQVDMTTDMCSCLAGLTGAPCKHQFAVTKHFSVSSANLFPLKDVPARKLFYRIATGCSDIRDDWFQPLVDNRDNLHGVEPEQQGAMQMEEQDGVEPEQQGAMQMEEQDGVESEQQGGMQMEEQDGVESECRQREEHEGSGCSGATALHQFKQNLQDLLQKVEENKVEMLPAVNAFNRQFEKIKTTTGLSSALFAFNKATGVASVVRRGLIPVQPTAVARRTTHVGGRRCLQSGRKPSTPAGFTDSKRKQSEGSSQLMPKKKRYRAPHNLSDCVKRNENLGKTHSSKL